jgi:excisionase family DNA binding protein
LFQGDSFEKTKREGYCMKILSVKQVAEVLGVSRGTMYNYIYKGGLPAYRLGGKDSKIIIYEQEFKEWLSERKPVLSKGDVYELPTKKQTSGSSF